MKQKQKKFNNIKKVQKISFRWALLNKLLISLIIVLGVYYVACTNDLTVKGFVIQDLKIKAAEYEETNKKLELAAYELNNTENINNRAKALKMVKVGKIDYITVVPATVAQR